MKGHPPPPARGLAIRVLFVVNVVALVVFLAAIASALSRGLDISCGCFNTDGGHAVGVGLLWRDLLLLLACLPPLLARHGGWGLDRDR